MNPSNPAAYRLSELLGASVVTVGGQQLGHVNDVRLAPSPNVRGVRAQLVVDGLVLADRHAGSMLGYDRRSDQGPWLVRLLVRRLHRNARYLPWTAVRDVSWVEQRVTVDPTALEPLATA
jgi:hypothetical protein